MGSEQLSATVIYCRHRKQNQSKTAEDVIEQCQRFDDLESERQTSRRLGKWTVSSAGETCCNLIVSSELWKRRQKLRLNIIHIILQHITLER